MNISKIFKICVLCFIGTISVNSSVCNAANTNLVLNNMKNNIIHLDNVDLVDNIIHGTEYSYTDMTVDNNIFKHNAVSYNNNTVCYINENSIDICKRDKHACYGDTNQQREDCCKMYLEKI